MCGTPQAGAAASTVDPLDGLSPRTASLLCYVPWIGWIGSVIVLASAKFRYDRTVRFHAFQGLYLFVAYLIVEIFMSPFAHFAQAWPVHFGMSQVLVSICHFALIVTWVFMLIKTGQGIVYRLPVLGELADRSVAEQV